MTSSIAGAMQDIRRREPRLWLLFAPGERPAADTVEAALRGTGNPSPGDVSGATVSHRPPDDDGWIELLASGLAFELHGLAPAAAPPRPPVTHAFGFDEAIPDDVEALALIAGPHIAAGGAMIPLVRTMTGLAAGLALSLPVRAVCWEPADSWMAPRTFARAIIAWLAGGPFPVPGLTALVTDADGVTSDGLGFFAGQEVRVVKARGETLADTAKLAMRVIDDIVRCGAITTRTQLDAPFGAAVIAEPSADGRLLRVWRGP